MLDDRRTKPDVGWIVLEADSIIKCNTLIRDELKFIKA
jgi:hypothetical protein